MSAHLPARLPSRLDAARAAGVTIACVALAADAALGVPSVTAGASVTVASPALTADAALVAPSVLTGTSVTVTVPALAADAGLGVPEILIGTVVIVEAPSLAADAALGTPVVAAGTGVLLSPPSLSADAALGSPTVLATTGVAIEPPSLAADAALGVPTVVTTNVVTVACVELAADAALGVPAITLGSSASVAGAALAADPALGVPQIRLGRTVACVALSADAGMGYPTQVGAWALFRIDMAFGGIDLTDLTLKGMSLNERMGAPDTLEFKFADFDQLLEMALLDELQDIRVSDATGPLFRGQVTVPSVETIHYSDGKVARTYSLRCESYERLIPKTAVSVAPAGYYSTNPDGTTENVLRFTTAGGTVASAVRAAMVAWWTGRPALDLDSCLFDTHGAQPIPIDNTTLGQDLDALASLFSDPTLMYWIDGRLRFHWVAGSDTTNLEPAPCEVSSVAFGPSTVMSTKMLVEWDAQNRLRGAYVSGATPWASGWVGNTDAPGGYAPDAFISSERAKTAEERDAFAARFFANDARVGVRITFTLPPRSAVTPAGYDGWHKGQYLYVSDPGSGLVRYGCVVQEVRRRFISMDTDGPLFEYDITAGDSPRRSLSSESKNPEWMQKPAAVIGTKYVVTVDQVSPDPDQPPTVVRAQLANADGVRIATQGIAVTWHLAINGTTVADPTDTTAAYYLAAMSADPLSGVPVATTGADGVAYCEIHCGDAWTSTDRVSVEAETVDPT